MLQVVLGLLGKLVDFLTSFLPESPFANLGATLEGAATGIGWLNWLVPVSSMLGLLSAWLVGLAAYMAAYYAYLALYKIPYQRYMLVK